jgi:predicted ATPase/class 3 adenylate cyclase
LAGGICLADDVGVVLQPSGTVTLVFTDVEGSTRLLNDLGRDGYLAALDEQRRIVRAACAQHSGYEVDTAGDGFFYAFAAAGEAVAAVEESMAGLADSTIRIRAGIHTGEPGLDPPKYVGQAVHKAARIMGAGHGGQVLLSQATRGLVDGLDVRDLGEHRLKDFDEPVRLFQLGHATFPALKTLSNTNLPVPTSSFVGREREVAEVTSLLRNGGGRLVTLAGPGGSGKTRLAIEAASEVVGDYPDGVFWVGLASLRDPALVSDTVGQALGSRSDPAEQVGSRTLLVVLDNFEHVIDAAAELSALLGACRNLRLLVTSRELLRLQGEVEYQVPPLDQSEAEELFSLRSHLPRDEEIADLCRHLDDLPLAVELAAARTAVLSPAEIRDRLSQRLDLFKGGRDADPRQQTLRATIEWSYELLAEPERTLFARLAVFAGGCTLDTAEGIVDADIDTMQSLVDKSLVRRTRGRFWMLETIAELARERLNASDEADEIGSRHAHWFLALAEEAAPFLKGPEQPAWLQRLEDDHDNLRKSLDRFFNHDEPELALRLAAALYMFWYTHGHVTEGRRWLGRALDDAPDEPSETRAVVLGAAGYFAMEQGELDEANELLEASLACAKQVGAIAAAAIAAAQLSGARVLRNSGSDVEAALSAAEEGLALARTGGDDFALAIALNCLGVALSAAGDNDRAKACYEESLEVRRRIGDNSRIALALCNLAWDAHKDGDLVRAASLFTDAAEIATAIGDKRHIRTALGGLGWIAYQEHRWQEAESLTRESLRLDRELGMKLDFVDPIFCLAGIAAASGDTTRAARLAGAAEFHDSRLGFARPDFYDATYRAVVESAKAACDPDVWARASAEGRAMSLEDAVDYALSA